MEKKNLGIMRYLEKPYCDSKNIIKFKVGSTIYTPDKSLFKLTGEIVYTDDSGNRRNKEQMSKYLYGEYSKDKCPNVTEQKSKMSKPQRLQPVYYIIEEHYMSNGKESVFVEAKFAKYVSYPEWRGYPLYTAHTVNLVH